MEYETMSGIYIHWCLNRLIHGDPSIIV